MKNIIKNTAVSFLAISFAFSPLVTFAEESNNTNTEQTGSTENTGSLSVQNSSLAVPACDPNIELVKNGGFEDVVVTHQDKWQIFSWNTQNLGWESTATKYGLEVQAGLKADDVLPWAPYQGNQYAEIDGGLDVPVMNKLSTNAGTKYKLTFAYSPRPQQTSADNNISVYFNGSLIANIVDNANNMNTAWTVKQYEFVATTSQTYLSFIDQGVDNNPSGYGMFIDSVSVKCVAENNGGPVVPPANTPPVLTLLGNNPMTIVVNTPFVDPGATSTDAEDGDLTSQIQKSGTVNASSTGSYTISYTVADSKGSSVTANRVVNVVPKTITHTCALPGTLGDGSVEPVVPGTGPLSLQDVITAKGYGLNVINDQKQYQVWNTQATTSVTVEYIHRDAVLDSAFGFSTSSGSFVPVFKNGVNTDHSSAPTLSVGQTANFDLPANSEIAFAINTGSGKYYSTKIANNQDATDHAVVYEIDNNVFLIAFEDLPSAEADNDFNDLIVKVTVNNCNPVVPPPIGGQCPLVVDHFSNAYQAITYETPSSSRLMHYVDTSGLGGELDVFHTLTKTTSAGYSDYTDTTTGAFALSNGANTKSTVLLVWDGKDANANVINYTGLNGKDLSLNGQRNRINFTYSSDFIENKKVVLTFRVYTDANNASQAVLELYGASGSVLNGSVPFSSFTPFLGSGANMSNVGAISLLIDATSRNGIDFTIDSIELPCTTAPVNTPPTITLVGSNPIEIIVGNVFTDPGATANDLEDGNLTSAIVKTGSVNASTTGTYTLTYTVTDSGGLSASTTRTVIVKPTSTPTPKPVVTLTGNPSTITVGATTTLNWTSNNATSCSAAWTSATSTSGSAIVAPATTTNYAITCTGAGGSSSATTTITVNPISNPDPKPTVTLTGNPSTIDKGNSSTLSWSSTNATSCSAAWTSATSTSGTASVTPSSTTEYSISCTGAGGSASATTTITVNTGGGGGGGGGGGSSLGGSRRRPQGEILGATTCFYLRDHLKMGWNNDSTEMLKLKTFLNVFEQENLSLNSNFDQATFDAVSRFQNKYFADILEPWGHDAPTGFVYILTKKKINEIFCRSLFPVTSEEQNEINAFRALLENLRSRGVEIDTSSFGGSVGRSGTFSTTTLVSGSAEATSTLGSVAGVVVDLAKEGRDESDTSILRNVAITLFSSPRDTAIVFGLLFLILLAIMFLIFSAICKRKQASAVAAALLAAGLANKDQASPVVAMPGVSKKPTDLPEGELVIEEADQN